MKDTLIQTRTKIIETLCILDDAQKFGWLLKEQQKAEKKLAEAIGLINLVVENSSNNPN